MTDDNDPNNDFINALMYLGRGPLPGRSDRIRETIPGSNVGTFKRLLGPGLRVKRSGADTIAWLQKVLG